MTNSEAVPSMSESRKVPLLELVLPGTWLRVPVGDHAREEALLDLVRQTSDGAERAAGIRALLDTLARTGGDELLLRQDQPALLTTAWPPILPPPGVFAGGDAAVAALQAEAGAQGVPVTSAQGYAVIRVDDRAPEAPPSAEYWIAHPVSGRILVIAVTDYVKGHASDRLYDLMAGNVEWQDVDPLADGT